MILVPDDDENDSDIGEASNPESRSELSVAELSITSANPKTLTPHNFYIL